MAQGQVKTSGAAPLQEWGVRAGIAQQDGKAQKNVGMPTPACTRHMHVCVHKHEFMHVAALCMHGRRA